jgi:secreted Zn-dependent insulinase-like peptidase
MAATTLAAILASWKTVVEDDAVALVPTVAPFTHDQQPNGMVANSYYLEDGGNVQRSSMTNNAEVRIDRVTFWIAYPVNFDGDTALQALETLVDTIYRALLVQARTDGYNVEADTRRITRPAGLELLVASQAFTVDFDFSTAAT